MFLDFFIFVVAILSLMGYDQTHLRAIADNLLQLRFPQHLHSSFTVLPYFPGHLRIVGSTAWRGHQRSYRPSLMCHLSPVMSAFLSTRPWVTDLIAEQVRRSKLYQASIHRRHIASYSHKT